MCMLTTVDIWGGFITIGFMIGMESPSSLLKILQVARRALQGQQDQQGVQGLPDLHDQQGRRVQQNLQDH
ncbi:hypothetical protein DYU05_05625 [Mucilaginibacter terrenus]|uniref:Uncharacterized protein n=1 Tax=Mucilaginibacter terrenus TaxID=2482727 RepID=A0A3E2NVZ0_9SPHI|nr:hypothetical protein DYU05_05625 [Mucilaginibacter terrenus]